MFCLCLYMGSKFLSRRSWDFDTDKLMTRNERPLVSQQCVCQHCVVFPNWVEARRGWAISNSANDLKEGPKGSFRNWQDRKQPLKLLKLIGGQVWPVTFSHIAPWCGGLPPISSQGSMPPSVLQDHFCVHSTEKDNIEQNKTHDTSCLHVDKQ